MMLSLCRVLPRLLSLILIVGILLSPTGTEAAPRVEHPFPRLANYFLGWSITAAQVPELAHWDVLILDMENQVANPERLKELRRLNPDIILLAYITPQEIARDALTSKSTMRRLLGTRIKNEWYFTNSRGEKLSSWPGTWLLNVTNESPRVFGQTLTDAMAGFVSDSIVSSGLWDGVFYDNAWDSVRWAAGNDVDTNHDGANDSARDVDALWREGLRTLYATTRALVGDDYLIIGNGLTGAFQKELNGTMVENFTTPAEWGRRMGVYNAYTGTAVSPRLNVVNANTANTGARADYRNMRYGLGSTLLLDGYYSFDFGDRDHGQTWRYDEYEVSLGQAVERATTPSGDAVTLAKDGVYMRSFERGVAVVNATDAPTVVTLPGDFEKIKGKQDPIVNNGAIVSELTLQPRDSVILMKTIERIQDVFYRNGSFARFLRPDGTRVRNGFFLFDDRYRGGDIVGDLFVDTDELRDTVVASGARLRIIKSDGVDFGMFFPYTANYRGELHVALGDVNADGEKEIIVAPSKGNAGPIKIYNKYGDILDETWYPFGKTYTGGMTIAAANVDRTLGDEFIIGAGVGSEPMIRIYTMDKVLKQEWRAFEAGFKGGVSVAAGDIEGNGLVRIVAAPLTGKVPLIRMFGTTGIPLLAPITPYITTIKTGLEVGLTDVNFDGKLDIVALSK